jgi:tetratricopeptide (TPR) repeat protein
MDVSAEAGSGRRLLAHHAIVCAACGTRNKASWAFCAGCGEDLAVAPAPAAIETAKAEAAAARPGDVKGGGWIALLYLSVALVAGFVVWRLAPSLTTTVPAMPTPAPVTVEASAPPVRPRSRAAQLFDQGRSHLERGDAAGALPLLAEAVQLEPSSALYRHGYARTLWMTDARPAALEQYEAAARLAPDTVVYRADLARALRQEGRAADAVREFERVLSATPDDVETLRELARLLRESGATQRSVELSRRAAALRPTDLELMHEVGRSLEASGDWQGAAEAYSRILTYFADASVVRGRLAEVLLRQGKVEEAVRVLETGIEKNPRAPRMWLTLASVLERSGRVEDAIVRYREFSRLAAGTADAEAMSRRADELEQRLAEKESAASESGP